VYILNCLTSIQSTLGLYEWAADKFERLEAQVCYGSPQGPFINKRPKIDA
jgi:hypothetical protein